MKRPDPTPPAAGPLRVIVNAVAGPLFVAVVAAGDVAVLRAEGAIGEPVAGVQVRPGADADALAGVDRADLLGAPLRRERLVSP